MKLTHDLRAGILIGICLVGVSPKKDDGKKLFDVLQRYWKISMDEVLDGELRDELARSVGMDLEQ